MESLAQHLRRRIRELQATRLRRSRRLSRYCSLAALLAAAIWLVLPAIYAQPSIGRGVTKGFRFPDYDEQRRLKSMLTGKEARAEAGDRILITDLRVETYGADGKVDMIVEAPQCVFDRKSRVATSAGGVEAHSADGRFFISGEGFEWRQADAHLFLSNRVHTVLSKELLNPTKPNP